MPLAHITRLVTNHSGDVQSAVVVRLLVPGSIPANNQLVTVPHYADPQGTVSLSNPSTFSQGIIDFYMDVPQFVQLGIKIGAAAEEFYDWIPVNTPVAGYENDPGVNTKMEGPVLEVTDSSGGQTWLALHSPNGQRWIIGVADDGSINATAG